MTLSLADPLVPTSLRVSHFFWWSHLLHLSLLSLNFFCALIPEFRSARVFDKSFYRMLVPSLIGLWVHWYRCYCCFRNVSWVAVWELQATIPTHTFAPWMRVNPPWDSFYLVLPHHRSVPSQSKRSSWYITDHPRPGTVSYSLRAHSCPRIPLSRYSPQNRTSIDWDHTKTSGAI